MPRSGRGGARVGTPGKAYSNRTDLNQPVTVAPSQQYGQGVQQAAAQSQIPLPNGAAQVAQMSQQAAQAAQAPAPTPPASAQAAPVPGSHGPFMRPTDMPSQPVTTGMPFGPGAGPQPGSGPTPNIAATIANIARISGNQALAVLAQRAQAQAQPTAQQVQNRFQPTTPEPTPMPVQAGIPGATNAG